jgi:hypothetical protein
LFRSVTDRFSFSLNKSFQGQTRLVHLSSLDPEFNRSHSRDLLPLWGCCVHDEVLVALDRLRAILSISSRRSPDGVSGVFFRCRMVSLVP